MTTTRGYFQMSGKGGKGGAGKGKKPTKAGTDEQREDALQAVVSGDILSTLPGFEIEQIS